MKRSAVCRTLCVRLLASLSNPVHPSLADPLFRGTSRAILNGVYGGSQRDHSTRVLVDVREKKRLFGLAIDRHTGDEVEASLG